MTDPDIDPGSTPGPDVLDRIADSLDRIATAVERNAHGIETANLYAVYSNADLQYRLTGTTIHKIEDEIILRTLRNEG